MQARVCGRVACLPLTLLMIHRSRESDDLLSNYLATRPEDAARLNPLILQRPLSDPIFLRTTFPGHITASGFVVARETCRVLLIEHKRLGRLLQPGGHIESTDESLLHAAVREVREETSVDVLPYLQQPAGLVDIDIHTIPAGRGEPQHDHYDFRFVFVLQAEHALKAELTEVHHCMWAHLASPAVRGALGERSTRRVLDAMRPSG